MLNLIVLRFAAGTPRSPFNENSPCQGLEPHCLATLRQPRRRNAPTFGKTMPLPNLCNQLVVMRTRRSLHSQAWGLRPSARRDLPALPLTHEAPAVPQVVHDDVGWPLPASPTPSGDAVLTLHQPALTKVTALARATRSPEQQPVSALSASTSPVSWLRTPPVVPSGSAGFPASPRRTRTPSADDAPTPPFSRIRSAIHR